MEPFLPSIWNVLHDGTIERVEGSVPGEIRLVVSIEYLRERFPEDGDELIVTLTNCTQFSWRQYEDESATTDLAGFAEACMSILSAEMEGEVCRVFGDLGVIELECSGGSIHLDAGRRISLQDLLSTAKSYWDEWSTRDK